MLNFIYTWKCYRNLKSGFLLDFFMKSVIYYMMSIIFNKFSLFFFDKYLIELISKKLYNSNILNFNIFNKLFSYQFIKVFSVLLLNLVILIIIYML